jgi:hypothetical protein
MKNILNTIIYIYTSTIQLGGRPALYTGQVRSNLNTSISIIITIRYFSVCSSHSKMFLRMTILNCFMITRILSSSF